MERDELRGSRESRIGDRNHGNSVPLLINITVRGPTVAECGERGLRTCL